MNLGGYQPAVSLIYIGLLNGILSLLWSCKVSVEKFSFPSLCPYGELYPLFLSLPTAESTPNGYYAQKVSGDIKQHSGILKLWRDQKCIPSVAAARQLILWEDQRALQLNAHSVCPKAMAFTSQELLQLTITLRVFPMCEQAEIGSEAVYKLFRDVGGGPADLVSKMETRNCILVPSSAILAAAGVTSTPTFANFGSAGSIFKVKLMATPEGAKCDLRDVSNLVDKTRVDYFSDMDNGEFYHPKSVEFPVSLFVGVSEEDDETSKTPSLYVGSGKTLILMFPKSNSKTGSNDANDSMLYEAGAVAVMRTIGSGFVRPEEYTNSVNTKGQWRVNMWRLFNMEPEDKLNGNNFVEPFHDFIWPSVSTFIGKIAALKDIMFSSKFSYIPLLEDRLKAMTVSTRGSVSENFFFVEDETGEGESGGEWSAKGLERATALHDLKDMFDLLGPTDVGLTTLSEDEINIALIEHCRLQSSVHLTIPDWGYLTCLVGDNRSNLSIQQLDGHNGNKISISERRKALIGNIVISQLRQALSFEAFPSLQTPNYIDIPKLEIVKPQNIFAFRERESICGKKCIDVRTRWKLQPSNPIFGTTERATQMNSEMDKYDEFSYPTFSFYVLKPQNAQEVHEKQVVDVRIYGSTHGVTDWEVWFLANDLHSSYILETVDNIRKFQNLLNTQTDLAVPERAVAAMESSYALLHCSILVLRGQSIDHCIEAEPLLQELIKDQMPLNNYVQTSKRVNLTCGEQDCPISGKNKSGFELKKFPPEIYIQLAVILARIALSDSLQMLHDPEVQRAPYFTWEFSLAIHLPLAIPFIFPTILATLKLIRNLKKKA